jgi:hypothetical protein
MCVFAPLQQMRIQEERLFFSTGSCMHAGARPHVLVPPDPKLFEPARPLPVATPHAPAAAAPLLPGLGAMHAYPAPPAASLQHPAAFLGGEGSYHAEEDILIMQARSVTMS